MTDTEELVKDQADTEADMRHWKICVSKSQQVFGLLLIG